MNRKFPKSIYSTVLALLVALMASMQASADVRGFWQQHPAADIWSYTASQNAYNNCVRILDGERFVYFQVLAKFHDNRFADYADVSSSLFRLDKSEASPQLLPVSQLFGTSRKSVTSANYSPDGGFAAVTYEDGMIDILYDNGDIREVFDLKEYVRPGSHRPNSVAIDTDGKRFYVATGSGVMTVDAESGRTLGITDLNCNISHAARIGGRMVVFANGTAYAYDLDNAPKSLDNSLKIKIDPSVKQANYLNSDNTLYQPEQLMPLTEKSFAYSMQRVGSPEFGPFIHVVTFLDDGSIRWLNIGGDKTTSNFQMWANSANHMLDGKAEGLFTPTREGYLYVGGSTEMYLIRKGVDPDYSKATYQAQFATDAVRTVAKMTDRTPVSNTEVRYLKASSADGVNFWFFYPREGLRMRTASTNGATVSWSEPDTAYEPQSTVTFRTAALEYSPEYGMLARNNSDDGHFSSSANQADGLSAYRNGTWTYLGLSKTNFSQRDRVPNPKGIGIDPLDGKYVWGTSKERGMLRQNLDDPEDLLNLGRSNSPVANRPGFIPAHPYCKEWTTLSSFAPVRFDADGTLWTNWVDWDIFGTDKAAAKLRFWTAEDRLASVGCEKDASLYIPMGEIVVPTSRQQVHGQVWPLKLDLNRNLVGFTAGTWYEAFVLDHNGTPKDTSDDRIAYLTDVYNSAGEKITLNYPAWMFEDPYDGKILISYQEGLLVTSREQLFGDVVRGDLLEVERDPAGMTGRPIAQTEVTGIAVDNFGRKWIATFSGGVFCLSEDRKELLAHFMMDNSDLLSDNCLAIAFNPETRSIWIGTDKGLTEFVPSGAESALGQASVIVTPAATEPGYRGYITVSNLVDSEVFELVTRSGEVLATGLKPSAGQLQLHAPELQKGEYRLRGSFGNITPLIIVNQ